MIEVGDRAYYRYRIGMFNRTTSGKVIDITDDIATLEVPCKQNCRINVNKLTKNKVQ